MVNEGRFEFTGKTFLCNESDKRFNEFMEFKEKNGFFPDELWSLYSTISVFILPRLKYFRDNLIGHPADITEERWLEILDKMILAFEIIAEDSDPEGKIYMETAKKLNTNDYSKIMDELNFHTKEGFDLFHEYFFSLWQ